MERLTYRDKDGFPMMKKRGGFKQGGVELLAAYEDTGLTPELVRETAELAIWVHDNGLEKIKEWIKADKDGRLVVLPVKPVFTPILLYIIEDGDIYEDALYEAVVGMSGNGEMNVVYTTLSDQIIFEQADIGKTVFFTREEAKKALEGKRNA
uniref:Uncharacterized protein n=1 Tax=Siphoviridae sp. ctH1110 TaxID=2826226 RepID=A0A8S5M5X6_9CAUD|nr:MAG TPA: hypothetical protein [Siphoviridae sp. ctH1110]